ncbi:MAG: hypothetical protein RLO81_08940 [Fulvivirga sp.]|uniref:hypothetical protein n=1 Tax=Fulvivirga sp. TaxID=1931237 RepID=UPI0032EDAE38
MGLQDLFITPIYILLLSFLAYMVRPFVTTPETRRYFLPALWVRFFGAIMLGVIYQFYYGGGDTFNYWEHGSRWIWEAFWDDLWDGIRLLTTSGGTHFPETFEYSQHIWYYRDPNSYFIVRLAAFIDLFTFHTYSATALFFAAFSFSGLWAMFSAVATKYPTNVKWLALGILFFPSVVFWGSGILKDTITLGALGWLTWGLVQMIEFRNRAWNLWIVLIVSFWLIVSIKVYIVICYIPMIFIWSYWKRILAIKNGILKFSIAPILFFIFGSIGYLIMIQIGESNSKYSLDNIAERAAITAFDIRYGWGARTGGEGGYDLGELDGSWSSMLRLFPQAVNVSLFRPYLWEVRNPLMLLASFESFLILAITLYFLLISRGFFKISSDPFLLFCFLFALLFSFAVGVSTANFGTLMRYKIPLVPFYMMCLIGYSFKNTKKSPYS